MAVQRSTILPTFPSSAAGSAGQSGGVQEGDTVFLLGYPGRTARPRTASQLDLDRDIRLPMLVEMYQWQIAQLTAAGSQDRGVELKMLGRIKSLANVEKRGRGQLQGLRRAALAEARHRSERSLQAYIEADQPRRQRYGHVLGELDALYARMGQTAEYEFLLDQLRTAPRLLAAAWFLVDAAHQRAQADLDREEPYADKNFERSLQLIDHALQDLHLPTDQSLLRGLVDRLAQHESAHNLPPLAELIEQPQRGDGLLAASQLAQPGVLLPWAALDVEGLAGLQDPLIEWMRRLYPTYVQLRESTKRREGQLNELYGLLLEIKQQQLQADFVPDANGTLRLTCGTIRGYNPADAVFKSPISTFRGVVEKTTGQEPFVTPEIVMEAWRSGKVGSYRHPELNEIPVALLYDTDTTGGNSGSPVLNSRGELVGINFDRCFEATINDFAWNANYSRSIGVDIRYVLWLVDQVYEARNLLAELTTP